MAKNNVKPSDLVGDLHVRLVKPLAVIAKLVPPPDVLVRRLVVVILDVDEGLWSPWIGGISSDYKRQSHPISTGTISKIRHQSVSGTCGVV